MIFGSFNSLFIEPYTLPFIHIEHYRVLRLFVFAVLFCFAATAKVQSANLPAPVAPPSDIKVLPTEGFNLQIVDILPATETTQQHMILRQSTPSHNWFAISLAGVPVAEQLILGFSMAGNSNLRNTADVKKWRTLLPVISYTSCNSPASFICYEKDTAGHWISNDIFKSKQERDAGTGLVPRQKAVPAELAEQFLTDNGTAWVPWRWLDRSDVEVDPTVNILRIKTSFAMDTVSIAMRVPYQYLREVALLDKLQAAKLPGVTIDLLGLTPNKHKLQVIRLDPPDAAANSMDRPTICVYARENGTEPDGSHAVEGMLHWLLSDDPAAQQSRRTTTWLLVPMLDVDAAVNADYRLGDFYSASVKPPLPEAVSYATYLVKRLNAGGRLDMVINLHNLENQEGSNLVEPVVNPNNKASIIAFNTQLFDRVKREGYTAGNPKGWQTGEMPQRLAGWCGDRFSALDLVYELNACDGKSRLSLPRLQRLGAIIGQELAVYLHSPEFVPISTVITQRLTTRKIDMEKWWLDVGHPAEARTPFDLFTKGY